MTLEDLISRIDWSVADASYERWVAQRDGHVDVAPESQAEARASLLDGAMHLLRCVACNWKGFRHPKCPECGKDVTADWDGRMWARACLGPCWEQAERILKEEGLVLGHANST